MDRELLKSILADAGEPDYRASQVWEWVARGARDYAEMTNLPAQLRERLAAEVPLSTIALEAEAQIRRRDREGPLRAPPTAGRSRRC